ncbi:MAG: diguanylate cyclase [Acidobacteria bacterium]|nr:diguanylate cyclase [Acidobacteriota bacterium]
MSSQPERTSSALLSQFGRRLAARIGCMALALVFAIHSSQAQQFFFSHYGQDEGLLNLDVFSMVDDVDGALWMATENGLFRYDGAGFAHVGAAEGLGEQLVLGMYKDAFGRIWVTSNDHLYTITGTRLTAIPLAEADSHFGAGQLLAAIDSNRVAFIVRGSLRLIEQGKSGWKTKPFFDAATVAAHPELSHLHSVFVSSAHEVWLGCGDSLCRVRGDSGSQQIDNFSRDAGVPAGTWQRSFEDRQGNLWLRSSQHILVLQHGESRFSDREIPDGLGIYSGSGLLTFAQDAQGNVLTQTDRGLARWEHGAWRLFDNSNGVVIKDTSTILFDRGGNPWFATRGHGIYRWLGYGEVENWTTAQGMSDEVAWPMFRDSRGRMWLSDQFQVSLLDEKTHRISVPKAFIKTPLQHATGFAESRDGSLWFFRINGEVVRTDPEVRRITFRAKLPDLARNFTDSSGRLWIMSREGLFVIRDPAAHGQPVIEKIADAQIAADAFADAAETPDHDLWFLADSHLYRLAHNSDRFERTELDAAATRGQMRGIAAAADGSLWIGGGIPSLLHLRVGGGRARVIDSVTTPTLASQVVQIVRMDRRGRLWIGTDLGINVFDGKSWRLLTRRDGIVSSDTDEGAFFADEDGSAWIAVNGGTIHVLHPESLFSNAPLDVRVTSASLGGHALSLLKTTMLHWQDDSLDVGFTSSDLAREPALTFRYRLTGLESAWSETPAHTLHYAAVPPGDYRFELQAIDRDRQRQSPPVSFSFTIRPPWWRTSPFYFVLALLTFLASILVWHWRERRLISRQRMLRHLVAQRTRELEAEKAELVAAREALRTQATRDALTGVWNRPAILDILIREMDRAHRGGLSLAVVLADIDHFKQINDTMGHLAGDAILRDATQRMFDNIRPYDFLGRYGGEEFLIVMPGLPWQDPHARLSQLQRAIAGEPFDFEGRSVRVTSSFGVAWLDPTIATVEDLVRRADEALYQAKALGRDRIVFYSEDQLDTQLMP